MFKPNYSTCIECKQQRMIVVKKGYCKRCNELKKGKSKPKIKFKKKTGEIDLFKEIAKKQIQFVNVVKFQYLIYLQLILAIFYLKVHIRPTV